MLWSFPLNVFFTLDDSSGRSGKRVWMPRDEFGDLDVKHARLFAEFLLFVHHTVRVKDALYGLEST